MSRLLRATVLTLLVASCGGGGNYSAPRNLDDACSILDQRPSFLKAMQRSERRWGIPVHVQMATIYQESKFIGNARTPFHYVLGVIPMGRQSSAYGYSQALDATWKEYKRGPGVQGPSGTILTMPPILWVGICRNRPNGWESVQTTPVHNIWPITKAAAGMRGVAIIANRG